MEKKLFLALLISMIGVQNGWAMDLESEAFEPELDSYNPQTLVLAVYNGNPHAEIQSLLDAKADINGMTSLGTAMHQAVSLNTLPTIDFLLKAGADIDLQEPKSGETPLTHASIHGNIDAVKALIQAGASRKIRNARGETPLGATLVQKAFLSSYLDLTKAHHQETIQNLEAVIKILQEDEGIEADPSHEIGLWSKVGAGKIGLTPIAFESTPLAVMSADDLNRMWSFLGKTGLRLNEKEPESGRTQLHFAAHRGCWQTVKELIYAEADVTLRDREQQTALDLANAHLDHLDNWNRTKNQERFSRGDYYKRDDHDYVYWKNLRENILPIVRLLEHSTRTAEFEQAAYEHGDELVSQNLLAETISADDHNDRTEQAVRIGCQHGNEQVSQNLLAETMSVDDRNRMWQFLWNPASDVNAEEPHSGRTQLHFAALQGDSQAVRALLQKDADPALIDGERHTALDLAISQSLYVSGLIEKAESKGPSGQAQAERYRKFLHENMHPIIRALAFTSRGAADEEKQ